MTPRSKSEKSRKGCQRCKVRRIKCDGLEPECHNCLRRGFKCPGQRHELRWSTKHEVHAANCLTPTETDATSGPGMDKASNTLSAVRSAQKVQSDSPDSIVTPTFVENNSSSDWDDLAWLDDLDDVLQFDGPENQLIKHSPAHASGSVPSHLLLDLPTTLVEYWFSHICPVWSAFDSHVNYNRKIPHDTWTTSEPVFYALQAISAAFLADSMPQMTSLVPSLITQATSTIQNRILQIRNAPCIPGINITIDLLFAVFAMGTSMHWADAPELGDKLMQDARDILGLWQLQLSSHDAMVHAYFHQALTWWEMMSSLADRSKHISLDRKRLQYQMRLHQAMNLKRVDEKINESTVVTGSQIADGGRLHPWCGASSEVIDLFGQCVALCRSSRNRHRNRISKMGLKSASEVLCDIAIARQLQQELLQMDFDVMVAIDELRGISLHTGDEKTPIAHLVSTAEAYRHASLMQLYLTFEDLEIAPLPSRLNSDDINSPLPGSDTRQRQLLNMALQLVSILEQIPVDSGSRCIQPPLLILAAAGLRLSKQECGRGQFGVVTTSAGTVNAIASLLTPSMPDSPFSSNMLEVAKARRCVKSRLLALQATLPIKPLKVASDLIDAIWREYDGMQQGADESHWLDVMNDTGLKTIFG